ncbi:MAG: CocE/NonD family hydrolase [Gemmatimonadales bacterium]|nr:CocE/NonD family hydrolase [Gemmatimonadales bacterium]
MTLLLLTLLGAAAATVAPAHAAIAMRAWTTTPIQPPPSPPQAPTYPVRVERRVMVPMRDGVRLATDLYLPEGVGRAPVVMTRSPYGRAGFSGLAETLARAGYVGVWQDVRGRFDSEGEWVPFVHEADDGFDAIQWAATQPWSDGRVFMLGGSYVAMVQWLAASRHNPHLAGLITMVSPGDFYQDFLWEGGAFNFGAAALWTTFVDGRGLVTLDSLPWDRALTRLPLREAVRAVGHDPAAFRQWIDHPTDNAFWRQIRWDDDFPRFGFPVLHIGGWFDVFQKGTVENFRRMTTRARPAARGRQHLVIGPWGHTGWDATRVGAVDFGKHSALELTPLVTRFLDRYARGRSEQPLPAVRVFLMGENQWREFPTWPAPGTTEVAYFLRGNGRANGADGDGLLAAERPGPDEPADRFRYDPANPVPTTGGGNCCWPNIVAWGPLDQRPVEARPDVLVYSTAPLEADVRVLGPVQLELWIASSASNTDFTGKLVDVAPDGFAMNLTDGIQRVTHREGDSRPVPLRPGSPTRITVDLWNTGHVFRRGHRIRLEVSSSNFPRYSRNLNTGGSPETTTAFVAADQTVFHDRARPSRLILPVVPW